MNKSSLNFMNLILKIYNYVYKIKFINLYKKHK